MSLSAIEVTSYSALDISLEGFVAEGCALNLAWSGWWRLSDPDNIHFPAFRNRMILSKPLWVARQNKWQRGEPLLFTVKVFAVWWLQLCWHLQDHTLLQSQERDAGCAATDEFSRAGWGVSAPQDMPWRCISCWHLPTNRERVGCGADSAFVELSGGADTAGSFSTAKAKYPFPGATSHKSFTKHLLENCLCDELRNKKKLASCFFCLFRCLWPSTTEKTLVKWRIPYRLFFPHLYVKSFYFTTMESDPLILYCILCLSLFSCFCLCST